MDAGVHTPILAPVLLPGMDPGVLTALGGFIQSSLVRPASVQELSFAEQECARYITPVACFSRNIRSLVPAAISQQYEHHSESNSRL